MVPLFTDEDIPQGVVDELNRLGVDVVTALKAGLANQRLPDANMLAFATSLGRTITTHNRRDYARLHLQQQPHSGIIVCTRDDDHPQALAQRIFESIQSHSSLANQLIRIYRPAQPPVSP